MVFTRKPTGDGFWRRPIPRRQAQQRLWLPCRRYENATKRLSRAIEPGDELTVQDPPMCWMPSYRRGNSSTLGSMVADLSNGMVLPVFLPPI